MTVPTIYIIIPAYADSSKLRRTVDVIERSTALPFTLDVQIAAQSVVANKNAALKRAALSGARFVAFCDDDVEPDIAWDELLLAAVTRATRHTRRIIGQVSPRLLYPDGRLFSAWLNIYFDPSGGRHRIDNPGHGESDSAVYSAELFAGALPGTCTIFDSRFLESVGWHFDDRYERSQFEDIDQSLTCRWHGFELLYAGSVRAIHHMEAQNPRASVENRRLLLEKWESHAALTWELPGIAHAVERVQIREGAAMRSNRSFSESAKALFGKNTAHRIVTGCNVLVRSGPQGLKAHVMRILNSAPQSDSAE
jgi:hypothetical protein